MTNGKILGLDIGIASVGVGIIDANTGDIIHASSRLFNSANPENNATRRSMRSARRLLRRRKHRVERVESLFEKYDMEYSLKNENYNPYEIRVKGLSEQLTNEELFIALRNLVKHRGISYLDEAEADGGNSSSEYKEAIQRNEKLLKEKMPSEIQLERLNKFGQIRGDFTIEQDGQKIRIINVFSTNDYKKETLKIFENQPQLTEEFKEDYLKILLGKRKYYQGPGNEKSRTNYGIYRVNEPKLENLFSILIGTCSYYPSERRASTSSYSAQEFNFLNDLVNLKVPTETGHLSENIKRKLVNIVKNENTMGGKKLIKYIAKEIGCKEEEISGFRKDAKDNPDLHTFEPYRKLKKFLDGLENEEEKVDIDALIEKQTHFYQDRQDTPDDFKLGIYDELMEILTINTEREGIEESIQNRLPDQFSEKQILSLCQFRRKYSKLFSKGWHNFSVKLMQLHLISELYIGDKEQMSILSEIDQLKSIKGSKKTVYLDEQIATDEIYNPVVAKSVRQAIKIINLATKKYGDFDRIMIEMPRDKNEDDQKEKIKKRQKENKNRKDKAIEEVAKLYCGSNELPTEKYFKNKKLHEKILLWYQQEGICPYSGKYISPIDLVDNITPLEIDHIIPLSISFDDSFNNKVLVYREYNQEKGQRTPFQSLDTMDTAWSYRELANWCFKNKKITKTKREYLLSKEDYNKIEVKQKFIARNLVDTAYASRTVLNYLTSELRRLKKDTKVGVIRGAFTHNLRMKWKIDPDGKKSRETNHHHAIDALIIAASSKLRLWEKTDNPLFEDHSIGIKINQETGEAITITDDEYKELVFSVPYVNFINQIKDITFKDSIKFSYQVDSKPNRQIADATIYSTRLTKFKGDKEKTHYVLGKVKDIYSKEGYKTFRKIYDEDKSKFLLYNKDSDTWNGVIEVILSQYPDKKVDEVGKEISVNPFLEYRNEFGMIRKLSKKGKGPEIKNLKYYDSKLSTHINLSNKVGSKDKTVALKSLNPWRADVYFNETTKKYEILGLRYADLRFEKGKYTLTVEKYQERKNEEKISANSIFKFSLFKNDLIMIKDSLGNVVKVRFLSRTMPNNKNYVELKPIEKSQYKGGEDLIIPFLGTVPKDRCKKSLGRKNISIYKIQTDVLGNQYLVKEEKGPILNIKL